MGGMDGFGQVVPEQNEPVFHADWERRAYALVSLVMGAAQVNIDEFRHAIERIPPARYLASSYYERWLAAAETVARRAWHRNARRTAREGRCGDRSASDRECGRDSTVRLPSKTNPDRSRRARVSPRAIACVRATSIRRDTRALPRYVRGKAGVIARDWGVFVFPDTNAHHAGTKPQHCYSVSFDARELWGKPASRERCTSICGKIIWNRSRRRSKPKAAKRKTARQPGRH